MCKFYGDDRESKGVQNSEDTCYGLPPQIRVTFPNGNEEVNYYRPVVNAKDPRCSLFVTHPDCVRDHHKR